MPIEVATWISELNPVNPAATDDKSGGDDHLRLIKNALTNCFPNAAKAFRFPDATALSASASLTSAYQNRFVLADPTAGAVALTLPSLGADDAGWMVWVIRTTAGANALTVVPAAGTIQGSASISIGTQYQVVLFFWTGTAWHYTNLNKLVATDITSGTLDAARLPNDGVTNARLADMAQSTIKGRAAAAGTGDPTDLTAAQVRTILNVADGATAYVHPNHTGDVTSLADGATTIAADAVTNTKLANMSANLIKGRISTSGDPQDLTATQVRTIINVADGATANSSDATLLARANHTGSQAISTVSGLQTALDARVTGVRLDGHTLSDVLSDGDDFTVPTGCVMTGLSKSSGEVIRYRYAQLQYQIDGVWTNAATV